MQCMMYMYEKSMYVSCNILFMYLFDVGRYLVNYNSIGLALEKRKMFFFYQCLSYMRLYMCKRTDVNCKYAYRQLSDSLIDQCASYHHLSPRVPTNTFANNICDFFLSMYKYLLA